MALENMKILRTSKALGHTCIQPAKAGTPNMRRLTDNFDRTRIGLPQRGRPYVLVRACRLP